MPDHSVPAGDPPSHIAVVDPNADIIINPSNIRAIVTAAISLFVFASSFCVAIAGFVSTRDLAGAIVYLQSQQTITGLVTAGGAVLFVYRMVHVKRRTETATKLAIRAPGAALSQPVSVSVVEAALPPPTRAPETETDPANTAAFLAVQSAYEASDKSQGFGDFMADRGWRFTNGRWRAPLDLGQFPELRR